jgi:hypothetical protein
MKITLRSDLPWFGPSLLVAIASTAISAGGARAQSVSVAPPEAGGPSTLYAPPEAGAPPTPVAPPRPIAPPRPVVEAEQPAAAVASDPNIDRGLLQPTAMTQPSGSLTYNNYELLLHGLTYGVTDNLQISLTVLSPITRDIPFIGIAALKWRFEAADRLHVALQGSLLYGQTFSTSDPESVFSLGAGAYASVCLRQDCSSLLTATLNYQLGWSDHGIGDAQHILLYGGSVIHRVSEHVKLLAEITSAAAQAGSSSVQNIPGFLLTYGVRFFTGSLAGDIAFVKPVGDTGDDGLLLGIPFVNISYRW